MNRLFLSVLILTGYFLLQGCAPQNHANTIVRDKDNVCIIRIIVQLGIEGTDDDVAAVTAQMEECFKSECFIPCESDKEKGCKVTMIAIVKKWSSLTEDEKWTFHQVTMVDEDGLPSFANIGRANSGNSFGTWRRNAHTHTYCHETMHLLGLPDRYCSRLFNAVDGSTSVENRCDPPPDPGQDCCTPRASYTRCSSPCAGHDHDLMGSLEPGLSCENIKDVLSKAGFGNCPDECCSSPYTFHEFFVGPSYLHFGDKEVKFGAYGATLEYTYPLSTKVGLMIDGGYYQQTDKEDDFKQKNSIYTLSGGISYKPNLFGINSKLDLSTHALLGVANYKVKSEFGGSGSTSNSETSLSANLGVALNYKLNNKFDIRLMQVDYIPTFFAEATQNNYRLSVGLEMNFGKK